MNISAQLGKSPRLGDRRAREVQRVLDESLHDLDAEIGELFLDGAACRREPVEICQSVDGPGHHSHEQRLLAGEMGIDGRFARRGQLGDIVDAGTPKAFLEKELLGCIENPRLDVAGKVLGRPAAFRAFVLRHHRLLITSLCAPRSHLTRPEQEMQ